MTITPGKYDLVLYQGTTFTQTLTWKDESGTPVNLTGYTARMMARASIAAASPFLTLTTENGGITLGGSAGTIALFMSDDDTAALTVPVGIYDLELVDDSGNVTRLLQGSLAVSPEVTR